MQCKIANAIGPYLYGIGASFWVIRKALLVLLIPSSSSSISASVFVCERIKGEKWWWWAWRRMASGHDFTSASGLPPLPPKTLPNRFHPFSIILGIHPTFLFLIAKVSAGITFCWVSPIESFHSFYVAFLPPSLPSPLHSPI